MRAPFRIGITAVSCKIARRKVTCVGEQACEQACLIAANHVSWLDIPILSAAAAGLLHRQAGGRWLAVYSAAWRGCSEASSSIVIGAIRREHRATRSRNASRRATHWCCSPEGTSSDGVRVLPFRSAFFASVETRGDRRAAGNNRLSTATGACR